MVKIANEHAKQQNTDSSSSLNVSVKVGEKKVTQQRQNQQLNTQGKSNTNNVNKGLANSNNNIDKQPNKGLTSKVPSNSVTNDNIIASNSVSESDDRLTASNTLKSEDIELKNDVELEQLAPANAAVDYNNLSRYSVVIDGEVYELSEFSLPRSEPSRVATSVGKIKGIASSVVPEEQRLRMVTLGA